MAFKLEVKRLPAGSTPTAVAAPPPAAPGAGHAGGSSASRAEPTLQMAEPAVAFEGAQVETVSSTLRGSAAHASGIREVLVNDRPASLKTLSPQSVQFEFIDLSLGPSWTKVTVVARASDNAQTRMSFKLSRPQVRWLSPANGVLETSSSAILARGVALGFRDVRKVELAGTELTTENADGGVRFQTVLTLNPGHNVFEGFVTSTSGFRMPIKLEVSRIAAAAKAPESVQK